MKLWYPRSYCKRIEWKRFLTRDRTPDPNNWTRRSLFSFVIRVVCASLARVNRQRASIDHNAGGPNKDPRSESSRLASVAEINAFPFETFEQLQAAVAIRSFNVGVDALAAANWSEKLNSMVKRVTVTALSLLLVAAALVALVAAVATKDYWLLAAVPIQALSFYISHPASPIRKWVTIGGAASIAVFIDLLLNGFLIAATLVAYAGLTFAAVRAAGYIANSGFRKAVLSDERLFLEAYVAGECTIRNNQTGRVYSA